MDKTAIIYARVSTARQAADGLPVASQIEQCRAKATALGARVLQVFRDDGKTGRTIKRKGLMDAFDFCEARSVDYFICWSTSRFARNRIDAAMNKRLLDKMGVRLAYASQDFGEGDDGWLSEAITEVIDEQYSRQIAKDTRRSMAKNAADGFWNGGHAPFGYRVAAAGKRKRLEPDPAEVPTVTLIFQWCMEGHGGKEIAVRLNERSLSKRGQRWSKASVASVLNCRAAIGQLTFHGKVSQAHEPIISEEDFMKAQELIQNRAPRMVGGRPRSQAIFSGLFRCECGDAMTTECATGRGGARYHYYNCRAFLKGIGCRSHRLPVAELDRWLLDGILEKVFTPDNLRDILIDLKQSVSAWVREHDALLQAMYIEAEDINKRMRRLYESVEAGAGLELAEIAPRLRELRLRKEDLTREIEAAEAEVAPTVTLTEKEAEQAVEMFRDIVTSCDDPSRVRSFLSKIVRQIALEGGEVRIEYFPDRIVAAAAGGSQGVNLGIDGSQSVVRWLPELSTMRTIRLPLTQWFRLRLAA